jgi:Fe2+ transport system protein FeoA
MQLMPLPAVERDVEATVECLAGPRSLRSRLQELGLLPGARVRVLTNGSPCILLVGSTRLCLRGDEADAILVALG